nr:replication protein A 70 kDa DNA-binding subunit D-like [Ipomoea batatas]
MAPMYVLVEELDKDHTSVAIRLRAVCTYNVWHSRGRDQIKSRECVFHDEAGSYMHLHIPGKSVSPKNDFVEGNVYCIKNFLLVAHWYMYRLKAFEVLNTLDANILVDVIGHVVEIYSPLEKMINGRPSRLIDFVIEDLKGNQLKCTVWDDHVDKVKPFFKSDLLDPVVVLIQMGRIKVVEKSGWVKICSSYDATKLLFNENTLEFVEFRNSLSMQQQTPLKSITSNSTFSYGTTSGVESSTKMHITTLSEIFSKRESDPNDWYYDSCPKPNCNKKLELNYGMYDCGKCGGRFVKGILRYKLKIRVVDVNGTAPLLLWDREVLDLLCLKADELKAMQPSVMTKVPKDIRNLKGRDDPTESPIAATPGKQDEAGNETEAVKRSLLDEFSSTQPSKKKKDVVVKIEDEKEQGDEH